jgi:hypothetical protein
VEHEIVLQYPDHEDIVSTSGEPSVEVGGVLTAQGFTWLVDHFEDLENPPRRRYICIRQWNEADALPP